MNYRYRLRDIHGARLLFNVVLAYLVSMAKHLVEGYYSGAYFPLFLIIANQINPIYTKPSSLTDSGGKGK